MIPDKFNDKNGSATSIGPGLSNFKFSSLKEITKKLQLIR